MIKNAFLYMKKNIGKTVLLFVLMCVIADLVIVGLMIESATIKSMDQVRTSLGSEVTLTYNMQSMMKKRDNGSSMEDVLSPVTIKMADQLKALDYVKSYNYIIETAVSSENIKPVERGSTEASDSLTGSETNQKSTTNQNDFTMTGNTSMESLTSFTDEHYILKSGRLLTEKDTDSSYCVIETNLARNNDLGVGDQFTVTSTNTDKDISVELEVVGIYEIKTTNQAGFMMNHYLNPYNQIYTGIKNIQTLTNSNTEINSATYFLNDPKNIENFKALAKEKTDIDFEVYTLDAHDMVYQRSVSSLANMKLFSTLLLWGVVVVGSAVLCLILILTMRGRFYEFGVLLSLGQTKVKIMLQQLLEVGIVAIIALTLSIGTGKIMSNVVSSMLETSQISVVNDSDSGKDDVIGITIQTPANIESDISLTGDSVISLVCLTGLICVLSVILPSIYILRLSPREIVIKKER